MLRADKIELLDADIWQILKGSLTAGSVILLQRDLLIRLYLVVGVVLQACIDLVGMHIALVEQHAGQKYT